MIHISDNKDDDDFGDMDDNAFDDIDDAAFEDFDDTQKGSLKDVWQNNPLVKLGVVGIGLIVIAGAAIIFSGESKDITSVVKHGSNQKELPSQNALTPDMEKRIDEKNEFDYRIAQATGASQIPISTEMPEQGINIETGESSDQVDDPLAEWRNATINKTVTETLPQAPEIVEPINPVAVRPQPVILQPNPEMVAALSQGFGAQMRQILEGQSMPSPRHMQVTSGDFLNKASDNDNGTGSDGTGDVNNDEESAIPTKNLIPAGEVVYAQTLTEANTDAPGPVLAQILSGPLKGSRILGGFTETDEYLTMSFDRVIVDGETIDIDAVALDVDTTLPGVVTDVNHRYFTRVILPAAAAFVEGFGSAVAESGSTTVTVEGETVTSEEEDLGTREELLKGVGEGTAEIASFLEEEADNTKVMIKVAAGTPIGILFLEAVEQPIQQ